MKLLRFTASWCQPCKQLAKTLENLELDCDIEVVDVDTNPDLAAEYGVRGVPTLAIEGTDIKLVGAKSQKEILDWFSEHA